MVCERCHAIIPEYVTICPSCGQANPKARSRPQPSTVYGRSGYTYQQGYEGSPFDYSLPNHKQSSSQDYHYSQTPPHSSTPHSSSYSNTFTPPQMVTVSNKNDTALIAEIVLSLVGIFGVGWLMAGETTVGVLLLLGSFLLYWPLVILALIFTLGLGIFCLVPMAVGAIILNALLLNGVLNRKAMRFLILHGPPPLQ